MHIVECPGCGRKFKVARQVVRRQMKCSRCGSAFVGSSTPAPDAPTAKGPAPVGVAPPATGSAPQAARPVRPARSGSSAAGPIMLAVTIIGVIGIAVLAIAFVYVRTHPTVEVEVRQPYEQNPYAARRRNPPDRGDTSAPRTPDGRTGPGPRPPTPADPPPTTPAGQPKIDPMLGVGFKIVEAGAASEDVYICGVIHNRYKHALKSVTVTVYKYGAIGPRQTCLYVPPEGTVRYCIDLKSDKTLAEANVQVGATAVKAPENMIIWQIPDDGLAPEMVNDVFVWRGRTRNPTDRTASNVKVYIDYYDDLGIYLGSAPAGGLSGDERTVGPGKTARFRVAAEADDGYKVESARAFIGRVVAERF